jgi:N6-L-threonylcarbamoyladenine synthase
MLILGIETSCDDSSAAIFDTEAGVLSNIVSSQDKIHELFGGVVPEMASREHLTNLPVVVEKALLETKCTMSDIFAIAVTSGPGLIGSLLVGLCYAKAIAFTRNIPFIGVNHLEGHIVSPFIEEREMEYSNLSLIVSGGHTSLYFVKKEGEYELISSTRDDAAGEAFDKVAKYLGLGFPGGKIIDDRAKLGNPTAIDFPRGMSKRDGFDFSFSGLKSAVVRYIEENGIPESEQLMNDLLASFQEAVVDSIVERVEKVTELHTSSLLTISGGVAANSRLRFKLGLLAENRNIKLKAAPIKYCTDNAAMIAFAGWLKLKEGKSSILSLNAKANLTL